MKGWAAVNLFFLAMILVAVLALLLAFKSIRAMGLSDDVERILMGLAAIAAIFAAGIFGKAALATLEKRSRAR